MVSLPLLVVSLGLLIVVLMAANGVGSRTRIVGLHIPYIERTEQTWIDGHRAARIVMAPTAALAALLGTLRLIYGADGAFLSGIGWTICLAGFVIGCASGSRAAKKTLSDSALGKVE